LLKQCAVKGRWTSAGATTAREDIDDERGNCRKISISLIIKSPSEAAC